MAHTTQPPSEALGDELPPFSFSKKPIRNTLPASAIPANIHRAFCDESVPVDSPSFNNINYDDQIRAPRMSSATHYTYKPESPRPFGDAHSGVLGLSAESDKTSYGAAREHETGGSLGAGHGGRTSEASRATADSAGGDEHPYQPATADLNQPTRRNSEPAQKKWGISVSVGNILSLESLDDDPENSDVATAAVQQKLLRAVDNLNANTTSEERAEYGKTLESSPNAQNSQHSPVSAGASHSGRNRQYVVGEGPAIQQVYTQKKPMCLPAVLRPPQEIDRINEEDFLHESSPDESPDMKLGEFPFEIPEAERSDAPKSEPTHEHWRPNQSSDHCTNCFEAFRGFFNPQRRRRHHCRFCGLLYCQHCLYKAREALSFDMAAPAADKGGSRANSGSSNTSSVISAISTSSTHSEDEIDGVMLDANARLVVPLFKNLQSSGTGLSGVHEKFKLCKVCKTCGSNASRLMYVLNQRTRSKNDIDAPYVFIENPYLKNPSSLQPHPFCDTKTVGTPGLRSAGGERRPSYNNVPSDWTWSSF